MAEPGADPGVRAPRRSGGRPRKEPFEVREERLLDEAVAAFAEQGPGASIETIAGRAGINKALVYQHVGSKDELFAAAVRRERDRLVTFVAEAQHRPPGVHGRSPREGVRAGYHAFLDFAVAHPTSLVLLGLPGAASHLDGSGRDAVASTVADNLRRTLARLGHPDGDLPDVLAAMFVGMAGAVIRAGTGAGWDGEAVVDLLTDFTMAGMAGLDPEVLRRLGGGAS
ncbi:MAG: TetR/AcrR family transcriptional regulator [Acidimicrobiales bacterium]